MVGQHRSTQRKPPPVSQRRGERLAGRLREIAGEHPRWGWKTAHQILLREGWTINRKRTRRIWRQEGLRRPVRTRKRRRVGPGQKQRVRATHADHVWAIDFQFDETSDRRRLKLCNIVDEYTREALAIRVDRTCTAEDIVSVIEDLVAHRGAPKYLRADNGPELIAWVLRDYCRLAGTNTAYIEPGSPWENPFVESFNGRLRDELLNIEEFGSLTEAKLIIGGLANRVQHLPATLSTRRTHTHRIRRHSYRQSTTRPRINPGTPTGTPSRFRARTVGCRGARYGACGSLYFQEKKPHRIASCDRTDGAMSSIA